MESVTHLPTETDADPRRVALRGMARKFTSTGLTRFLQEPERGNPWIRMPNFRLSHTEKAQNAMKHVFGYTCFIDGSARDLPPPGNVFYQAKSRDTFAPMGPCLVTADEIRDPHNLQIRLWVNGALKQNFNTSDMAHRIPRCIEWVTSIHTLEPGDILATGTNHRDLSGFQNGGSDSCFASSCARFAARAP